jgi:hypothetical protein
MISYIPQGSAGAGTSSETIQQELLLSWEAQHGFFVFTYLYILFLELLISQRSTWGFSLFYTRASVRLV